MYKSNHPLVKVVLCSGLLLSLSSFNEVSAHHVHHHHYHYRRTRMIAHHHRRARHHRKHHKYWKWRNFYNQMYFYEENTNYGDMRRAIRRHSNKFLRMLPHLNYHQLNGLYSNGFHLDKRAEKETEARYNYFRNKKYNAKLRRISPKMTQPLANSGNNDFARQEAHDEFNAVNNARVAKGLPKLLPNPYLQKIANLRVKQGYKAELDPNMVSYDLEALLNTGKNNDVDSDNLAHGIDWHEDSDDDALKLHLAHKIDKHADWNDNDLGGYAQIGENLAPDDVSNKPQHLWGDASGDPEHTELNNNPQNIAHNNVYSMLHYDLSSHNGHQENIYSQGTSNLATASYYLPNKNDNLIVTVEEFH